MIKPTEITEPPLDAGVGHTLPFALAVPSDAQKVVVPQDELVDQLDRETAFLKSRGVEQSPAVFAGTFSAAQTAIQSNPATGGDSTVGTQTFSGNPVFSDDINADQQADVHLDPQIDSVVDQVNDD